MTNAARIREEDRQRLLVAAAREPLRVLTLEEAAAEISAMVQDERSTDASRDPDGRLDARAREHGWTA